MSPPRMEGLLETALYVADLPRSVRFYREVIGLTPLLETPRLVAFAVAGRGVLLLFSAGATSEDLATGDGVIPGHEGSGRLHMAFAVTAEELAAWAEHFAAVGVPLAGEVGWSRGGRSLYVRDPDGHAIEFASPGTWAVW